MPVNPYIMGAGQGLNFVSSMLPDEYMNPQQRWGFGQQKDLYDRIRWGHLYDQPAISPQMLMKIMANIRQGLQPTRTNMLWRSQQRGGGQPSPQTESMFMREYLPVEAGVMGKTQMDAARMNMMMRQFWESQMGRLAGA